MTYEQCVQSKADKIVVATDSQKIYELASNYGAEAVMSSEDLQSGSDRVAEVMCQYPDYDIVLNIQGDEPLVSPATINSLIESLEGKMDRFGMVTAYTDFKTPEEVVEPSNVKVVVNESLQALYFSRSPIPYIRKKGISGLQLDLQDLALYKKHLGLYAYTRKTLETFISLPPSQLELAESLEQLRLLQAGIAIGLVYSPEDSIGIDEQKDVDLLEQKLSSKN